MVALTTLAQAQMFNPVSWTTTQRLTGDNKGVVELTAKIDMGWHVYSTALPADGPTPTSVDWNCKGVKLVGKLTPSKAPVTKYDDAFAMELSWWTGKVTLSQEFEVTDQNYTIAGQIVYMSCNDENCMPPTKEPFSLTGKANAPIAKKAEPAAEAKADANAQPAEEAVAAPEAETNAAATDSVAPAPAEEVGDLWAPVGAASTEGGEESSSSTSLWYIIISCFLGGLVALLTPCVWPMIPLTVSFFLKKSGDSRAKAIRDAFIYGFSIIAIYLLLGLLITAIFGASSLNALATNAVCNIIFFLLLVVFAISFFGAFEIKLPDSWANKMDQTAERTTGLLSIFFMAFTLTLVSFSCTGPIIGTLLVEAASQGNLLGPAIGMFSFALALAIPFCLFAMFPSMLSGLPRSGGWMNTVKVVLGFIELALSLKFLSVADLAYGWHILDRETFLALWIAIFGLLGLYLLGKITFSHYGPSKGISVTRFFLATISLAFTVYLIPGLWGAPLKSVSAFVPPLYTQDFNLYGGEFTEYHDYEEGMKVAAENGKPVLIDFSGYGCVNCRKMEAAVFDNQRVRQNIEENFVMIKLMVDEKAELAAPMTVEENGKTITLTTVGDKWSYLQRYKFQANAQPYYVVLNARGELISGPYSYDEDIDKFIGFLNAGVKNNSAK